MRGVNIAKRNHLSYLYPLECGEDLRTGCSILVLDDDFDIRVSLRNVLEEHGCRVLTATNGRDALDILLRGHADIDFILTDLMMPLMDGATFLAEVGRHPDFSRIPVAVMSAHGKRASYPGAVAFLPKPLDLNTLLSTLEQKCCQENK